MKSFILKVGTFCWLWASSVPVLALELNQLIYITESSASFNYVQDGRLQGSSVELLLAATSLAGSPVQREDILVQPWARAYRTARKGPRTVLFSTVRTPERETSFQWVGPISFERDVLLALKSRQIRIERQEDLKNFTYGAVRGDIGEDILQDFGVPTANIVLATHVDNLGKMLSAGRIDLLIFGEAGWRKNLVASGIDPATFEIVYNSPIKEYYFAVSLDVDASLIGQFQTAVDQIQSGAQ